MWVLVEEVGWPHWAFLLLFSFQIIYYWYECAFTNINIYPLLRGMCMLFVFVDTFSFSSEGKTDVTSILRFDMFLKFQNERRVNLSFLNKAWSSAWSSTVSSLCEWGLYLHTPVLFTVPNYVILIWMYISLQNQKIKNFWSGLFFF